MSASGIRAAQTALNEKVLGKPGIEGTAIGQTDGKACLKVYISDADASRRVPSEFMGFPVVVEESGTFRRR